MKVLDTRPSDDDELARMFRQLSFPGGVPSHVAPETPGSIHEGGELGYSLELADPAEVHQRLAATLDEAVDAIGDIQTAARAGQRR